MTHNPTRLRLPTHVAELIRGLHPQLKRKVRAALEQILTDPHAGKALKDELLDLRSFRIGKFRVIYRLRGKYIDILALGPRERIYEETYRLLIREQKR